MKLKNNIGFMQGRLSPLVDGKIQAFPEDNWENEFQLARKLGISIMEWTLDFDKIYENPLLTSIGQQKISCLSKEYNVTIPSLTADFIMQEPYYKYDNDKHNILLNALKDVLISCKTAGIRMIIFPLVDNGSINSNEEKELLKKGLNDLLPILADTGVVICFESDLMPEELGSFINELDPTFFGINYDIGNSAALGYDPVKEIKYYGDRIINAHIKDRVRNGGTVPLGEGDAELEVVFKELHKIGYKGNYILQTARAEDGDHYAVLNKYKTLTERLLSNARSE